MHFLTGSILSMQHNVKFLQIGSHMYTHDAKENRLEVSTVEKNSLIAYLESFNY